MLILGIETTCDETGISIIKVISKKLGVWSDKIEILANEIATQYKIHSKYGGVVPILAAREHKKNLPIVYKDALRKAKINPEQIDYIAFAVGPGLAPALLAGKEFVIELSRKLDKPIIPVNHLFGHLIVSKLSSNKNLKSKIYNLKSVDIEFPAIGLIVSGGHTILLQMNNFFEYKKIGETVDDAIGECLDKAGRILGLEYPGGPKIEKLAKEGNPVFTLPKPMAFQKNLNFSFAGLKTAFVELVDEIKLLKKLDDLIKADLAASFQKAAFDSLLFKVKRAVELYKPKSLIVGGGVIANQTLRSLIVSMFKGLSVYFPDKNLATDNGVQIALAGYFLLQKSIQLENYNSVDINANRSI